MLLTKNVQIKVAPVSLKHYKELGYDCKVGDILTIKPEELTNGSHTEIEYLCDYCNKNIVKREWKGYYKSHEYINKDACKQCGPKKIKDTNLIKYGVENVMQVEEYKEHLKESVQKKYGTDNVSKLQEIKDKKVETFKKHYGEEYSYTLQVPELQDKVKTTLIKTYGVDHPQKSKEIQEKTQQTNINKYGGVAPLCNKEIQEKVKQTNIEKYGYEYTTQVPEFIQKMKESKHINGTVTISKQQIYINNLYNGKLNKPISYYNADIVVDNIDIEYDGGGHDLKVKMNLISQEEFDKNELIREKNIRKAGYNIMRIISRKDKLPSDDILIQMFNMAKEWFNQNHSWIYFDIDNECYINSLNKDNNGSYFNYGGLRKVTLE